MKRLIRTEICTEILNVLEEAQILTISKDLRTEWVENSMRIWIMIKIKMMYSKLREISDQHQEEEEVLESDEDNHLL